MNPSRQISAAGLLRPVSYFFKLTKFLIRCWTLDVRCSTFNLLKGSLHPAHQPNRLNQLIQPVSQHQVSSIQHPDKERSEQSISRILFPIRVTPDRATIIHLWMTVARHLLRPTRKLGRAALKRFPIWSCTGWGLPSFPDRPGNWCALTAPFHPYPLAKP